MISSFVLLFSIVAYDRRAQRQKYPQYSKEKPRRSRPKPLSNHKNFNYSDSINTYDHAQSSSSTIIPPINN